MTDTGTTNAPLTKGHYSVARVLDGWYALCRGDELRDAPLARTIFDLPVVLFRDASGRAATLLDRCAHRNAPLSLGTIDAAGHLACGYHGWRFDRGGACREVPGLLDGSDASGRCVPAFATREQDGFVWVWGRADGEPTGTPIRIPHIDDPEYLVVLREYDVECTMHAALENALDVPHTAFVHRGDFRGKGSREIEAVRRRIPGGIEVEYIGEPPLSGATTDAEGRPIVSQHWDRFFLPGVAQVEYRTSAGRHLVSTLPHTPVSDLRTRFWLVSCWKVPVDKRDEMRPIIEKQLDTILAQDAEILRQQTRRIREFGGESYRSTALDLMGPEILRMLRQAERGLPADTAPIDRRITLRVF
ncbi:MAG: aromatic ring-hydroxylating dioxygenase subunit alpha [Deltaproteobacteria bacterium]|nr:aromatic ring-hydroxylating dioxygenase subunit alpha [Deltaproteobacteria bacterium]MBI3388495.1 aromatic ring-hydroxylating dioxygenase subunit alpha [Deltaproteobacteria bacterium]